MKIKILAYAVPMPLLRLSVIKLVYKIGDALKFLLQIEEILNWTPEQCDNE